MPPPNHPLCLKGLAAPSDEGSVEPLATEEVGPTAESLESQAEPIEPAADVESEGAEHEEAGGEEEAEQASGPASGLSTWNARSWFSFR